MVGVKKTRGEGKGYGSRASEKSTLTDTGEKMKRRRRTEDSQELVENVVMRVGSRSTRRKQRKGKKH